MQSLTCERWHGHGQDVIFQGDSAADSAHAHMLYFPAHMVTISGPRFLHCVCAPKSICSSGFAQASIECVLLAGLVRSLQADGKGDGQTIQGLQADQVCQGGHVTPCTLQSSRLQQVHQQLSRLLDFWHACKVTLAQAVCTGEHSRSTLCRTCTRGLFQW